MLEFRLPKDLKKRRLKKGFDGEIELHEILLDKLAKKSEEELDVSEKKFEVPLSKNILKGFLFFCFLIIFALFAKTFQLQVVQGEEWLKLSQENKFIVKKIQAERGVIYDKNMKQLVFNQPSFDLVCEKNNLPESEKEKNEIITEVAGILKLKIDDLEKEIEAGFPHAVKLIFVGEISGEPQSGNDEIGEVRWFSPEEIEEMSPALLRDMDIKNEVKDYFTKKPLSLETISHFVQN